MLFKKSKKEVSNTPKSMNAQQTVSDDMWICRQCGTTNPKTNIYCKDCGTYK